MVFYKIYQYSAKATLCSVFFSILALLLAGLAISCFYQIENPVLMIGGVILCAAAAVFSFVYMSRILPDKIAEKDFAVKIKTSPKTAYAYCKEHPELFDEVAAENPAFAEKYRLNEEGKVVKIK